jgi:alpha-galactosidase
VEKWPTPRLENFLYMLRSGMMGWTTIMLDTTTWSAEQHEAAKKAFDLYKRELRPLIRDADLYHVSERPDGVRWDGLEYWNPARKVGVLYAFRGSVANEVEHRFVLAGLNAGTRYKLHFVDGSVGDREALGSELMGPGLTVMLKDPLSSEMVFIQVAAKR